MHSGPKTNVAMARIFITGSTDGLGRAAARTLIDEGHQVVLHARSRERAKAVADLDRALQLDPQNPDVLNGRAWFRATCPNATYRDGAQAIASATKACELAEWKEPGLLDTLAAAYAEAGNFAAAVKWQTKAIAMDTDSQEKAGFEERLKLYQSNKPYREGKP